METEKTFLVSKDKPLRDQIINTSIKLFNTLGCRFSMQELANELQISKKTLYKYFSSKEELLTFIINESFDEVHQKQHEIYKSNLSIEKKLREILTTSFNRQDSINMEKTKEINKYYPDLYKIIEKRYREEWTLVEELLVDGKEKGIFEYWSLSYIIELMKYAMSLVILHLNKSITYKSAIAISMNSIVDGIKK